MKTFLILLFLAAIGYFAYTRLGPGGTDTSGYSLKSPDQPKPKRCFSPCGMRSHRRDARRQGPAQTLADSAGAGP